TWATASVRSEFTVSSEPCSSSHAAPVWMMRSGSHWFSKMRPASGMHSGIGQAATLISTSATFASVALVLVSAIVPRLDRALLVGVEPVPRDLVQPVGNRVGVLAGGLELLLDEL